MSAAATMEAPVRPSGWPARSANRVALTGTIGGLAERLGAPVDFIRAVVILAAWAQPWMLGVYAVAAVAFAAPGERRPGVGSLVVVGRMAALAGLLYLAGFLPGITLLFDLDGEPASWIPFGAIWIAGLTALLVRGRPEGARPTAREAVIAAAPFVLAAVGFALAVVLIPDVRWERWLFVPTLIAAVALLVRPRGAWARAAIPPAAALAGASALLIGTGVRLEGGIGDTTLRPRTVGDVPREVRRGVGDVDLDLSRLRGGPGKLAAVVSVGVGTIDVTVPPRTLVDLDARLGQGRLLVDNQSRDEHDGRIIGRGVAVDDAGRPVRPRMRLRLRLRAGIGEITVNDENISTRWKL